MAIEVRQLVIRCQVVMPAPSAPRAPSAADLAALKSQLLAACRTQLREELQRLKER